MKGTYEKIEDVMKQAVGKRPLAAHEFREESLFDAAWGQGSIDGLRYVGCSESTLGRRLREMRQQGRVVAQRRKGKSFVEYALVTQPAPVAA